MSTHVIYTTTLGTLPVECECFVEDGQLIIESITCRTLDLTRNQVRVLSEVYHNLFDYLSDSALNTLRDRCQSLYDADIADTPRQRFR